MRHCHRADIGHCDSIGLTQDVHRDFTGILDVREILNNQGQQLKNNLKNDTHEQSHVYCMAVA